jgi:hypothetical protein
MEGATTSLTKSFEKQLNSHGYGFHFRVIDLAKRLYDERKSHWHFEVSEFPVEVRGQGTRIDFILERDSRRPPPLPTLHYLVAECKRANPALSNWCFIKAPYVRHSGYVNSLIYETAHVDESNQLESFAQSRPLSNDKFYQIALEVRSNEKGEERSSGRGAIEDAASQVLRGVNGMVNFLRENPRNLKRPHQVFFLPVIFTTAQIWVSRADLRETDLASGNIDLTSTPLTKEDWVFYDYHQSPGLKHSSSPSQRPDELGEFMESEYIRSIPIVSASGIENFLVWSSSLNLPM